MVRARVVEHGREYAHLRAREAERAEAARARAAVAAVRELWAREPDWAERELRYLVREPGGGGDSGAVRGAEPVRGPEPVGGVEPVPAPAPVPAPEPVPGPAPVPGAAPAPAVEPARNPAPPTLEAPAPDAPAPDIPAPGVPAADPWPSTLVEYKAVRVLTGLCQDDPRLVLAESEVRELVPLVVTWLDRGVPAGAVRAALVCGIPDELHHPARLLASRLRRRVPAARPAYPEPPPVAFEAPPVPAVVSVRETWLRTCEGCDRGLPGGSGVTRCRDCRPSG
ncbi:hypothetical protein G3I42_03875 [Streptomyces sp. SID11385]|nr:hypothetical protein [Streptomyces sp. SID11385]